MTDIVPTSNFLPALDEMPAQHSENDRKALAKLSGTTFLPYLRLMVTSAKEVQKKTAEAGEFILCQGKDNILHHFGMQFEALVIGRRAHACKQTNDGILHVYNMGDPDWAAIQEEADKGGKRGYWYGTEFLHWSPQLERFFAYHASSQTARSRCGEPNTILDGWLDTLRLAIEDKKAGRTPRNVPWPQIRFASRLQEGFKDDNAQYVPQFSSVTTPFAKLPTMEDVLSECKKFANPVKKSEKEEEPQGAVADRG